ncbi:MAG: lipocalin family protein, partial [Polyangiaceae bacterium]|nr:lipocalin family protein [Polyangiaceae bacterium]
MQKKIAVLLSTVALFAVQAGCHSSTTSRLGLPELKTVEQVNLSQYTGTWYEIAHFPQRFQKNCFGTTATYESRPDGWLNVVNLCHKGSLDGPVDEARGYAKVVDQSSNSKLKVSFFRPFWGD